MKGTFTGTFLVPNGRMFCFKLETGKSAKTYTGEQFGNFQRWRPLLDLPKGTQVEGLVMRSQTLIDGDSDITIRRNDALQSKLS